MKQKRKNKLKIGSKITCTTSLVRFSAQHTEMYQVQGHFQRKDAEAVALWTTAYLNKEKPEGTVTGFSPLCDEKGKNYVWVRVKYKGLTETTILEEGRDVVAV